MQSSRILRRLNLFLIPLLGVILLLTISKIGSSASAALTTDAYSTAGDLTVSQSIIPSQSILPGQQLALSILVSNTGPGLVSGLTVTNVVSSNISVTNISHGGAAVTETDAEPPYVWSVGALPSDQEAVIYLTAFARISPAVDTPFVNVVTIGSEDDLNRNDNVSSIPITITVPAIGFAQSDQTVSEAEGLANLQVQLAQTNPYSTTLVDYRIVDGSATAAPTGQGDFLPNSGTLTFTPGRRTQSIPLTILNDAIDEDDESLTVVLSNPRGAELDAQNLINVTIQDDDSAGIDISASRFELSEVNGSAVYSVVLKSQPQSAVYVEIPTNPQVSVSNRQLIFTPTTWDSAQLVTIGAVDDGLVEGTHTTTVIHRLESEDPVYDGLDADDIEINILDDDQAEILTSTQLLTVTEDGGGAQYTLQLTAQPTDMVTVTLEFDEQLRADPPLQIFTPSDWQDPRTVTISAVNDGLIEGEQLKVIRHSAVSNDPLFQSLRIPRIDVVIQDNDAAGLALSQGELLLVEGENKAQSAASYSVQLTSEPADVVTVVPVDASETLSITPLELQFGPEDWNISQSIGVVALDDAIALGKSMRPIYHQIISSDPAYSDLMLAPILINVTENDAPGVELSAPETILLSEAGENQSYTLQLRSQPTSTVTVALITDFQVTIEPPIVEFTPDTWMIPQRILLYAVDDSLVEGTHESYIRYSVTSSDPVYNGLNVSSIVATITDNDMLIGYDVIGHVFIDLNENGSRDVDEPWQSNVGVMLRDADANGQRYSQELISDADGRYEFNNVPAGLYTLYYKPPAGYRSIVPSMSIRVDDGSIQLLDHPIVSGANLYLPISAN